MDYDESKEKFTDDEMESIFPKLRYEIWKDNETYRVAIPFIANVDENGDPLWDELETAIYY